MMKRLTSIIICLTFILSLAGCKSEKEKDNMHTYTVGTSNVVIYYPDGNSLKCCDEVYQLKQPDSVTASVEEMMNVMSTKLVDDISYHTYMLGEYYDLSLEFILEGEISDEYEMLLAAAVTKTLFALEDVKDITINITTSKGALYSSKKYVRDSFYYLGFDDEASLNDVKVTLYTVNEAGDGLERKLITCKQRADISVYQDIINALEEDGTIPKNTEIRYCVINGDTCYIELDKDFLNSVGNVKPEIVVYAIVNSITSIEGISQVGISVDGMLPGKYRGAVDISTPLSFNRDLIK